jgi:hypothetical protein
LEIAIGAIVIALGVLVLINRNKITGSARAIHNRVYKTDKDGPHFASFQVIIPSVIAIVCGVFFIAMGVFGG